MVLEGSYPAEVKEQALCILGNIGDGEKAKDLIMANEDVLRKLVDYLVRYLLKIYKCVVCVKCFARIISNLIRWSAERY